MVNELGLKLPRIECTSDVHVYPNVRDDPGLSRSFDKPLHGVKRTQLCGIVFWVLRCVD